MDHAAEIKRKRDLMQLRDVKEKMRTVLFQIAALERSKSDLQDASSPVRLGLRSKFNAFLHEARKKDSVINPHPITRAPMEIVREIFEAAARADPDAPLHLVETCMAWRAFVLETPSMWKNIYIAVDDDDALKAFPAFLLFSKSWKLDVTIIGTRAPLSVVEGISQDAHRIRTLEIRLHKAAREPFRGLSKAPPDGLCSLSRLAVETHNVPQISGAGRKTIQVLEKINQDQNALDKTDLNLLQTLPMLSSLTSLVLHDVGIVDVPPLELSSLKSLRIMLNHSPVLLQSLKCNSLQTLDVILEDTSRDGWWNLLSSSLVYPQLVSLSVDGTLDREEDDWSNPWEWRSRSRLPTRDSVTTLTIALAFSDWKYIWYHEEKAEYLCGDLLDEFIACFPCVSNLHILHVPFLHSPFIWPMESILQKLRKLELNIPGVVHDEPRPIVELPNLWELRYYGYITPKATRLLSLHTPSLQYLEIMHNRRSVHPIHEQINRHWPGTNRKYINGKEYGPSKNNSVRNFPENVEETDVLLPVIHQSFALRELRLYLGNSSRHDTIDFKLTVFPALKRLHCSIFYLRMVEAPQLEELYLLWPSRKDESRDISLKHRSEIEHIEVYSRIPAARRVLNRLKVLDIYSHVNRFHDTTLHTPEVMSEPFSIDKWIPYLTSLRMVVFPREWNCIDRFMDVMSRDPHICPALTTITSLKYPDSWIALCHCLEVRNHLSMRDRSVQAIHTLHFPFEVHRNISAPLRDALSGEFAAPFVAIPVQPWTLHELLPQTTDNIERPPETACVSCCQSGNTFECEGRQMKSGSTDCARHWRRLSSQRVAITAYRKDISGYLE